MTRDDLGSMRWRIGALILAALLASCSRAESRNREGIKLSGSVSVSTSSGDSHNSYSVTLPIRSCSTYAMSGTGSGKLGFAFPGVKLDDRLLYGGFVLQFHGPGSYGNDTVNSVDVLLTTGGDEMRIGTSSSPKVAVAVRPDGRGHAVISSVLADASFRSVDTKWKCEKYEA